MHTLHSHGGEDMKAESEGIRLCKAETRGSGGKDGC